jgi:hypothetical protein
MCLKSFNLLNVLSMRQRRTSTEPSLLVLRTAAADTIALSSSHPPDRVHTVARAPDRTDRNTRAIYFIRGWSGGFGLDEFQLAPYGMKSMSEKGWDESPPKVRECQPAMSYDTFPERLPSSGRCRGTQGARLQARDHRRPILGQLGSNGRRSRKGLYRPSTMADRATIWTQARRQRLAKKHFDAIRTAHPRD